jgi:hypothetical protein
MPIKAEYKQRTEKGLCSACALRPAQAGRKCEPCRALHSLQKRQKRQQNKIRAIEYKGGKCSRCGTTFTYPEVYDFHHRNREDKEMDISRIKGNNWENFKDELDKCDLLCANCHRITHVIMRETISS